MQQAPKTVLGPAMRLKRWWRSDWIMSTGSTGSLFNIESPEAPPLSVERAREEAFAMPIYGPAFGRSPSWFLDRPALTVAYWTAVCVVYRPEAG